MCPPTRQRPRPATPAQSQVRYPPRPAPPRRPARARAPRDCHGMLYATPAQQRGERLSPSVQNHRHNDAQQNRKRAPRIRITLTRVERCRHLPPQRRARSALTPRPLRAPAPGTRRGRYGVEGIEGCVSPSCMRARAPALREGSDRHRRRSARGFVLVPASSRGTYWKQPRAMERD